MQRHSTLERVGGWESVRGVLAVAGFVALPIGTPLSSVVTNWLPALDLPFLGATLTGLIWLVVVAWLLDGVRTHVASQAQAVQAVRPAGRATAPRFQRTRALPAALGASIR